MSFQNSQPDAYVEQLLDQNYDRKIRYSPGSPPIVTYVKKAGVNRIVAIRRQDPVMRVWNVLGPIMISILVIFWVA